MRPWIVSKKTLKEELDRVLDYFGGPVRRLTYDSWSLKHFSGVTLVKYLGEGSWIKMWREHGFDYTGTHLKRWIFPPLQLDNTEWLTWAYYGLELSTHDIARVLHVSPGVIERRFKLFNIPTRPRKLAVALSVTRMRGSHGGFHRKKPFLLTMEELYDYAEEIGTPFYGS